ncbi:MAG: amino acid ABC transporter substrate-binding protein [Hyphomicrobiales bacterium]|jgi:branched-chain amino acid transport system substrate-binding protein|nr:amino acid ABC transporter substrate-binding protein [Xanthobacteraceae bacterium]
MLPTSCLRIAWQAFVALSFAALLSAAPALAADPMKVGVSLALTGGVAANGKQILMALEFRRDDINAKGGLLGRPVELVYYDDQSNPSNVPALYTKLITVDKVDLLLGPYATNMVAPAMPVIMQNNKTTISFLAIGINRHFNYPRYFSMVPVGPKGPGAFSDGFFELAAAQSPKPQTVAIVSADAEFAKTAADAARDNAKAAGFTVVYDRSYPPPTTDFLPVVRAVQAANPDIVYVAAYPPDTVGIVRSANEINLVPKMFGGAMIGMLVTPIKVQLGPLANGLVIGESFVRAPPFEFPGVADLFKRYQAKAAGQGVDALGHGFVPFGYAAGQVLAKAVEETKSTDDDKLAAYIHSNTFKTVVGDVAFGKDGEWAKSRQLFTQFQNVAPNDLEQFRTGSKQVILWPAEYKTGNMIYPYGEARKK